MIGEKALQAKSHKKLKAVKMKIAIVQSGYVFQKWLDPTTN
jgi:hypothetical protein